MGCAHGCPANRDKKPDHSQDLDNETHCGICPLCVSRATASQTILCGSFGPVVMCWAIHPMAAKSAHQSFARIAAKVRYRSEMLGIWVGIAWHDLPTRFRKSASRVTFARHSTRVLNV